MIEGSEWNAIIELIQSYIPAPEVTFAKVIRRDDIKKLIWVEEFGPTSIPLIDFKRHFAYYDTRVKSAPRAAFPVDNEMIKKGDASGQNATYQTKLLTPNIGQIALILRPGGGRRYPVCIGVIESQGDWGDEAQ